MLGDTVANATFAEPLWITGSGNTVTVNVQVATTLSSDPADFNDAGIASFNDDHFSINNGRVSLKGGDIAIDTVTGDDGSEVGPDSNGNINFTGEAVANATNAKPVFFDGDAGTNTQNLEVQVSTAIGSAPADSNDAGIASFDSGAFTVDANGFVQLIGGGSPTVQFTTDVSGPVTPNGSGVIDVTGTSIFSDGTTANTINLDVQATSNTFLYGQGSNTNVAELGPLTDGQLIIGATGAAPAAAALASADGSITITNGTNSIDLSVSASNDAILTLTGDAGGAVRPTTGNIDIQGVTVANAANAKPLFIQGTPGSSLLEADIQVAAAVTGAPGDKLDAGIASFDDNFFTVDTDGYTSLTGNASFNWVVETGATRNLTANQGVFGNRGTAQTFTLPGTAAVGDIFEVVQMGAGAVTIDYGTSQLIHFGTTDSTITTGNITTLNQWDAVKLVCNVADTEFTFVSSIGSWSIT